MFPRFTDRTTQRRLLGAAFRTIRKRRGLAVRQTARAMGMSLRSYERFEAGDGEIKLEKLFRFAVVTNSDPLGVVVEVYLGEAGLADQCADHKPLLINALALKRFCAASPDDLRLMDPVTLIDAFSRAYEDLGDVAKKRRAIADEWLSGTPPDADPKDDDDET